MGTMGAMGMTGLSPYGYGSGCCCGGVGGAGMCGGGLGAGGVPGACVGGVAGVGGVGGEGRPTLFVGGLLPGCTEEQLRA
eukprot:2036480-Pleurochrysis_carterae.AAC.4